MVQIALDAVRTVCVKVDGKQVIDIKNFAKVEKIPGGELTDSQLLRGVMFNKDVTSAKMRRKIKNPRIVLLDCPLEYRKAESQTNVEITKESDWRRLLEIEEEYVMGMCNTILALKPDLVITEKGVSDLALHVFTRKNVSVIRRLRKSDNNRVAKASGATIVSRVEELKEADLGLNAGLFEVSKLVMNILLSSRNAGNRRRAPFCSVVVRRMFSTRWSATCTMRWQLPAIFSPIPKSYLAVERSRWLLRTACRQSRRR